MIKFKGSCALFMTGGGPHRLRAGVSPPTPFNNKSPLYLAAGGIVCETMNLVIEGPPSKPINASLPMILTGSTSQNSMGRSLFMAITGSSLTKHMNLVILGGDSGGTSRILRLIVTGGNPTTSGEAPLFIQNNNTDVAKSTPLFIGGAGQNPGFTPLGESMNLFVKRGPNAGTTLFIQNNAVIGSVPLQIIGAPALSNSLPLYMNVQGGAPFASLPMQITGGTPNGISGQANMAIPKTIGFVPQSAILYIHGFNY